MKGGIDMKRLLAFLLLTALLLSGCTLPDMPEILPTYITHPDPPEAAPPTQPTVPSPTAPAETEPLHTTPAETGAPHSLPYTLRLHAAVAIYDSPSYDGFCKRIVGKDGVYTIVEEVTDAEGNLWGKLKSGAGWVDLTALESSAGAPVTAAFADDALLRSGNYIPFTAVDSEYTTALAFRAREPLQDVTLTLLEPDMETFQGYQVSETLFTAPELLPGTPLVAEVVFYGDMTAYGITCTTAGGSTFSYAVTISGRNGALVVEEFTP